MKTLDKTERQVLLRKYMQQGLTFDKAVIKLNLFHDHLKDLRDKLRLEGKGEKDIEAKFRKEFEELCQKLERWWKKQELLSEQHKPLSKEKN